MFDLDSVLNPNGPPGFRTPKSLDTLLAENRVWREKVTRLNPNYFKDMQHKHAPRYMWIGCVDARMTAASLLGQKQGDMFVARNVANLVVNTDINLMSAVQYAVDYLQVEHLIVCGHYECGGIKAALSNADHTAPLENWLRNIRDVVRLNKDELDAIPDQTAKTRRLVELNVVEQCMNLFKMEFVQKRRVHTTNNNEFQFTQPQVHAMVYDPGEGSLKELDVDFESLNAKYKDIYNLY